MARSKLKKIRIISRIPNVARKDKTFIKIRGIGNMFYKLHEENFESEDKNYDDYNHGLSILSFKFNSYATELNKKKIEITRGNLSRTKRKKQKRKMANFKLNRIISKY